MKQTLLFSLMLAMATGAVAKDVTGKVYCNDKGLANVVVTDGTNFTTTDKNGVYKFNANDDADFIYIVTPSGYVASYSSGTPCFYKTPNAKSLDFELYEFSVPQGRYTLFAIGDTQPGNDHCYERMEKEAFPDLKKYGKKYIKNGTPVAGILLGDMVWDNLDTYGRYKNNLKELGYPVYPVIGNHDHEKMFCDDERSELTYKQNFGPNYYAFNMGKDYYIVLDNIDYKGNKTYDERLDDEQLEWVKNYTRYIPKGSHVFVAMHAPAYTYSVDKKLEGADRLMDILKDYEVSILSGHSHIHSNLKLRDNVREHMVGSIGGAWWLWNSQYCMDGTPMGYQVFESSPQGLQWHFKSLHHNADYQMKVFNTGTVVGHADEVCVKVWNYDENWKVEWYEDGVKKGAMKQFSTLDPDYKGYVDSQYAQGKKKLTWRFPMQNPHFFSARPSKDAKVVKIVVTDRFGNQYTEECKL